MECSGGHSVTVTVIAGMIYSVGHTSHKKWAFVSICCEDGHGPKLSSVICVWLNMIVIARIVRTLAVLRSPCGICRRFGTV